MKLENVTPPPLRQVLEKDFGNTPIHNIVAKKREVKAKCLTNINPSIN